MQTKNHLQFLISIFVYKFIIFAKLINNLDKMNILVINAGSSSLKFSLFDMANDAELATHEVERVASIADAVASIPKFLETQKIDAIAHRVAHGGDKFREPVIINQQVLQDIESFVELAPLHNPPALVGIKIAQEIWQNIPHIALFDTAFHAHMPDYAINYAIPQKWRDIGVRKYGFHGASHQYIMQRIAQEMGKPAQELKIISCHLGNGASICAINKGVSIDTSMGMSALEGLVMGTRCGDIDAGIFNYIHHKLGLSVEEIEGDLYRKSGLLGLSGISNDLRDIEASSEGKLAIEVFCYRLVKYIGAYIAALQGVDAIAFTGGIGEHSSLIREKVCSKFEYLNCYFDAHANNNLDLSSFAAPQISLTNSKIKLFVTKTREEYLMAKNAYEILI